MDPNKLLELLLKNPGAGAAAGGLAGSLLGGVLGGGKGGSTLIRYGGLATVGYVAWQAWHKHQQQKGGTAVSPGAVAPAAMGTAPAIGTSASALPPQFDLEASTQSGSALKVVWAMIAASKADGSIDAVERDRIFARVGESGLSQADQDEVLRLLSQPADLESIVRGVDTPELASEIYAASLLAVSPANRAERAWLDMLAARLGLEGALTIELDRSVESLVRAGP